MLQFVDSFYCAYNNSTQNVVLRLRQEEPIESPDSGNVQIQPTEVANIIMSKSCAEQLSAAIQQLFSSENNSAEQNGEK
ncbi:MAG: hypothetical protein Q4B37_08870 [Eubacteriales bacterium]|nr:hypothetical protein [Eubacteriales bacterium]